MSERITWPASTKPVGAAAMKFDRRLARIITGNGWGIQRQFLVFSRFFRVFFDFGAIFRRFSGFSNSGGPRGAEKTASERVRPRGRQTGRALRSRRRAGSIERTTG